MPISANTTQRRIRRDPGPSVETRAHDSLYRYRAHSASRPVPPRVETLDQRAVEGSRKTGYVPFDVNPIRSEPMERYEAGLVALAELAALHESSKDQANEATTRLQFIDRLLLDCLGWQPEDITAEEHYGGEYVDYAVGRPVRYLIVEAKREGLHFDVPAGIAGSRIVNLKTITSYSDTNSSAVTQVLRYCQDRGVPVAVLCNGHQLVAFLASRQDSVPPLEGKALLYSSLEEMKADFPTLWDLLSKAGAAFSNIQRKLAPRSNGVAPPEKLSTRLMNYPGFRIRSAMETDLKILGDLFLQDLKDESAVTKEFLEACYCPSGALSQYALVSKEILRTRYLAAAAESGVEQQPVTKKGKVVPQLKADVLTAALSRRPIIVLGDVGVGKTIFLRHLILIDAADVLEDTMVFYIDFGQEPALVEDLRQFIVDKFETQLLDDYGIDITEDKFTRAVHNAAINRFRKGINKSLLETDPTEYARRELDMLTKLVEDKAEHLRLSFQHMKATASKDFVIILDNIDQRPTPFQEEVFLIAQSLASTWPGTVFVSLRPETFFASRRSGSLTAYQPRVFTVLPPRVDQVIGKRLQFARKQLEETGRLQSFPKGLTLDSRALLIYLDVLIDAYTNNEQLIQMVDNLGGGNVRLALDFLSTFVGSGYGHEFIRAILFGENDYYDPQASAIGNLFDISTNDGREHFLLPILLALTQTLGESAGSDKFVGPDELYSHAQSIGFNQHQIGAQLERSFAYRLLEPSSKASLGGPCRITTVGSYMYKKMISVFSYVDAMIVDTPIVDTKSRAQITDAHAIGDRLRRSELFRRYLDDQWNTFGPDVPAFDWAASSAALREDIVWAAGRAGVELEPIA